MKILLLVSAFNSLTQRIFCELKDTGHEVWVKYAINDELMIEEVKKNSPDIIISPYLKKYIPKEVYESVPTYVIHPGIRGDRGANALDHAIMDEKKQWGVVLLKATKEFDGGDIYAKADFAMRDSFKASIYRREVADASSKAIKELIKNLADKKFKPLAQLDSPIRPVLSVNERKIDWQKESTKEIIKKIYASDSDPGVKDEFFGIECYLFGAHYEESLRGEPKQVLAKRDGAVCVGTIDGAIWISHMKEAGGFKLPSTYVLKDKIKGIKEIRMPLIIEDKKETFYEISSKRVGDVAYLFFNFHNGAMHSEQCIRLKYAIEYLKESCKVLVLMGGENFFSNGIHLNILEDSKKQGEDGWSNINAMNDTVKSILFADDVITVASFGTNAGAGGVFLGLACDYVIAKEGVVLNPHYKTLGLTGSEYHTYLLPKRVGEEKADELLDKCLPISAAKAKKIGMIDELFESENYFEELNGFCQAIVADEDSYYDRLYAKQDFLADNRDMINQKKEEELKVMHPQFWDEKSSFHKLRHDFVYKVCPTKTPKRLKDLNA